jgi:hypothetical protein
LVCSQPVNQLDCLKAVSVVRRSLLSNFDNDEVEQLLTLLQKFERYAGKQ